MNLEIILFYLKNVNDMNTIFGIINIIFVTICY